ncbi:hypothetical protein BVX97_03895 [bacterium E08(2017)]|nr:hypothetical protein BVX97_03895 [bacterium E08(2017)]
MMNSRLVRSIRLIVITLAVLCAGDNALAGKGCGGCKGGKNKNGAQGYRKTVSSVGVLKEMGDYDSIPEGAEDLKEDDSYHGLSTLKHYKKTSLKPKVEKVESTNKKGKKGGKGKKNNKKK